MKKLYIITKEEYSSYRRKLGFFRFQNEDLYFDFGMLQGSHYSYHEDGTIWRTSPTTKCKAMKEEARMPIKNFKGLYNLGIILIAKNTLSNLKKVKQKDLNKNKIYEVDIESFPSNLLNVVPELIEPDYTIQLPEHEQCIPPKAEQIIIKDFCPWISLTILGYPDNLLVIPKGNGFAVKHFNKRFSANENGKKYSAEAYSGEFIKNCNTKK